MPTVKAQQIPKPIVRAEDQLYEFCYHFPQYTFAQARKMPAFRVQRMLRAARKERAILIAYIVRAAAAPHTKGGQEVNKLLKELGAIIDS